ncbi:MAG: hypothetical protein QOD06_2053 [Candidatus Binatota bacterium]|nr:hypothetical protein [Candidatus Binatota bacterium]
MALHCPLCNAGTLSLVTRELAFQGRPLLDEVFVCSSCRETLLDAERIQRLREAIRREGLAANEDEIDAIVERVMMRAG